MPIQAGLALVTPSMHHWFPLPGGGGGILIQPGQCVAIDLKLQHTPAWLHTLHCNPTVTCRARPPCWYTTKGRGGRITQPRNHWSIHHLQPRGVLQVMSSAHRSDMLATGPTLYHTLTFTLTFTHHASTQHSIQSPRAPWGNKG